MGGTATTTPHADDAERHTEQRGAGLGDACETKPKIEELERRIVVVA
jgi:hypothetical protein